VFLCYSEQVFTVCIRKQTLVHFVTKLCLLNSFRNALFDLYSDAFNRHQFSIVCFISFEAVQWLRRLDAGLLQRGYSFDPSSYRVGVVVGIRFSWHNHSVSAPYSFRSSTTNAVDSVVK